MGLMPYLSFNGECSDAIELYKKAFDAKEMDTLRYCDLPPNPEMPPIPDAQKNFVLQSMLEIAGSHVRLSDSPNESTAGDRVAIAVFFTDAEQVRKAYDVLKVEGKEIMPLSATFFSPCYGQVCDCFGVSWQLAVLLEQ